MDREFLFRPNAKRATEKRHRFRGGQKRGTQTFLDEIESIDVALRDAPTSTHRQVKSFIMLSIARTDEKNCFISPQIISPSSGS
jgi:hypothetical protein